MCVSVKIHVPTFPAFAKAILRCDPSRGLYFLTGILLIESDIIGPCSQVGRETTGNREGTGNERYDAGRVYHR